MERHRFALLVVGLIASGASASELHLPGPAFPLTPGAVRNEALEAVIPRPGGGFSVLSSIDRPALRRVDFHLTRFDRDGRQVARRELPILPIVRDVATRQDGGFAVLSEVYEPTHRWTLSRFDPNGERLSDRPLFSDLPEWRVVSAALASTRDGSLLLAWFEYEYPLNVVRARRFHSNGSPVGPRFDVSIEAPGPSVRLDAAALPNGDYFVTWVHWHSAASNFQLFGRAFTREGEAKGDPLPWTSPVSEVDAPTLAVDPAGDLLVAWTAARHDPPWSRELFARGFGPDGSPRGEPRRYGERVGYRSPRLTALSAGRFALSWVEEESAEPRRLVVREIDSAASPRSETSAIYDEAASGARLEQPALASLGGNELISAWQSSRQIASPQIAVKARGAVLAETGTCVATADRLCLLDDRFEVQVGWLDFAGRSGTGTALPLADESGLFSFFGVGNLELLVKMIDACDEFGHFWFFAGATTNVEYTLVVTDRESGRSRTYFNPLGTRAAAVADDVAFACP